MVVKEDGTKWACQSCLKGHRVSGCTHTDRELTLVPKKGRPVTQCQHCRTERKKKSAHHKCDCAEPDKPHHTKEKCIHLREAEERAKAGFHDDQVHSERDAAHAAAIAAEQGCCCPHGGKCNCSMLRKDSDRSVSSVASHGPAVQKPRLESTRSDGSITVFANGHHKPVHRKNHAAHECGMPYKMPMQRAHTDEKLNPARRSVDSLALDSKDGNNLAFALSNSPQYLIQRRLSKSEHPSPKLSATTSFGNNFSDSRLPFNFSSLAPVQTNQSLESSTSDNAAFPPLDPMSSTADSSYDPWSVYPSGDASLFSNENPFSTWNNSYDSCCHNSARPALTAASSGTQSEIDDIPPIEDVYGYAMPSIQENAVSFNTDITMGDGGNANRRSLPPNFFGNTDFSLPIMDNEWQTSVAGLDDMMDDCKPKLATDEQGFEGAWQTPAFQNVSGVSPRATVMPPSTGRPPSQSVGSANVPTDDLIKQLFPNIHIASAGGDVFNSANTPRLADSPAVDRLFVAPTSDPSSASMDFSPLANDGSNFTNRSWDDGSISVPADTFDGKFHIGQDFSDPELLDEWSVQ